MTGFIILTKQVKLSRDINRWFINLYQGKQWSKDLFNKFYLSVFGIELKSRATLSVEWAWQSGFFRYLKNF